MARAGGRGVSNAGRRQWLTGSHRRSLGTDGRIALPRAWCPLLGPAPYVHVGPSSVVAIYPPERWEAVAEDLVERQAREPVARRVSLFLFTSSDQVSIDRQGRIVIPRTARNDARIGTQVVLLGVGDHAEVWSAARWRRYKTARRDHEPVI
jgi:MraZ protein